MKDYYKILNVNETSNMKDIEENYRYYSKIYHPDKNNNNEKFSDKYILINKAYKILSNKLTKQIYDKLGYDMLKIYESNHEEFEDIINNKDKKFEEIFLEVKSLILKLNYYNILSNKIKNLNTNNVSKFVRYYKKPLKTYMYIPTENDINMKYMFNYKNFNFIPNWNIIKKNNKFKVLSKVDLNYFFLYNDYNIYLNKVLDLKNIKDMEFKTTVSKNNIVYHNIINLNHLILLNEVYYYNSKNQIYFYFKIINSFKGNNLGFKIKKKIKDEYNFYKKNIIFDLMTSNLSFLIKSSIKLTDTIKLENKIKTKGNYGDYILLFFKFNIKYNNIRLFNNFSIFFNSQYYGILLNLSYFGLNLKIPLIINPIDTKLILNVFYFYYISNFLFNYLNKFKIKKSDSNKLKEFLNEINSDKYDIIERPCEKNKLTLFGIIIIEKNYSIINKFKYENKLKSIFYKKNLIEIIKNSFLKILNYELQEYLNFNYNELINLNLNDLKNKIIYFLLNRKNINKNLLKNFQIMLFYNIDYKNYFKYIDIVESNSLFKKILNRFKMF